MRRIIALILCMLMLLGIIPVFAEETADAPEVQLDTVLKLAQQAEMDGNRYAYCVADSSGNLRTVNSTVRKMGFSKVVEYNGKSGLMSTADNSNIFVLPNVSYWPDENGEGGRAAITVEYYDCASLESFSVHYQDSFLEGIVSYGAVFTEGSETWKTYTCYLENYVPGAEIRLRTSGWSTGGFGAENAIIRSIFIEENRTEYPIEITAENGYVGMVYSYGNDSDEMTVKVENTNKEAVKATVNYIIRDREGLAIGEKKSFGEVNLEAGEVKELKLNTGVTLKGVYTIDFEVEADVIDGGSYIRTFDFSLMDTYEEGDERYSMAQVCAHFEQFYWGPETFDQMARFGFAGFRSDASWNELEPASKQYVKPPIYKYIEKANELGIENMSLVSRMNPVYGGGGSTSRYTFDEASLQGYADAASWVANGYGGSVENVKYIEMFNEWNHTGFNSSGRGVDGYYEYAKVAYPAIKAANPDVKVIAGGTAGCDINFIANFVKLGGLEYCDGVSVHPYQGKVYSVQGMQNQIKQLNQVMMDNGGMVKPIYFTEMGFSRAKDEGLTDVGMPANERRKYIPQMFLMCDYMENVAVIYWYDLVDDGPSDLMREHRWGLFKHRGQFNSFAATDGMATLAPLLKWLPETVPGRSVDVDDGGTIAYEYKREDGTSLAALWTCKNYDTLSLNLGCDEVTLYDMYGNKVDELKATNGVFTFDLSNEVLYLEGRFDKFEKAEGEGIKSVGRSTVLSGDTFSFEIEDSKNRDLRIEYSYNPEKIEASIPDSLNGKAVINAKAKNIGEDKTYIEIKLYNGEELCYFVRHLVEVIDECVDVDIYSVKASNNDDIHWQMAVSIKNKSNSFNLSGSCRIVSPYELATPERAFYEISPQSKRTILINLPEMVKKRTQKLKVEVKLDNGYYEVFDIGLDFTTAKYAERKPTIDGMVEKNEWTGTLLCEDREEAVDMLTGFTWGGRDNLCLDACKLAWDEDYFYFMAQVRDDVHFNNFDTANLWQADSVQFGILRSNDVTIDVESTSFTEIGFSDGKEGLGVYRYSVESNLPIGKVENFEGAIVHDNGVTTYEFKIPWSELFDEGHKAKEGDRYNFSFLINDNDGNGRKGWIRYNDGIGFSKNPKEFGDLILVK